MLRGLFSEPVLSITGILKKKEILSGVLAKKNSLVGYISKDASISYYSGEYEITPAVDAQVMLTKNKMMANDVTVNAIPYYETSNPFGYTVYIGSVIND